MRTVLCTGEVFVTYQSVESDEVYGWRETSEGFIVPGSGGWWRTTDPAAAARMAESIARNA